jgi:putative FmdB family regulatory protein
MPIYDYTCRSCGHTFECLVRFQSDASTGEFVVCPMCHCQDLERLVSAFAVNSDGTRQLHLNQARKLARKEQLEKKHAEREASLHHDD